MNASVTRIRQPAHIGVEALVIDPRLQSRARLLDMKIVEHYTDCMRHGDRFPAVSVARIDGTLYVYDGFHRLAAAVAAAVQWLDAIVRDCGSIDEARELIYGMNDKHGLPRNEWDRRRVVRDALSNPRLAGKSDGAIAEVCKVSDKTVAAVRRELESPAPELPELDSASDAKDQKRQGRDGKMYGRKGENDEAVRGLLLQGKRQVDIARELSIKATTVSSIVKRLHEREAAARGSSKRALKRIGGLIEAIADARLNMECQLGRDADLWLQAPREDRERASMELRSLLKAMNRIKKGLGL